jgi:serum/glucocorticoid-regulated kinase 2
VGSMRPNASRVPQVGSYVSGVRPSSAAGAMSAFPSNHGRYSSKYLPYALVDFDKQQIFINSVSGTPTDPVWAGANTQYKFDVSRPTDVTISLYIRNPASPPNSGRNTDIFLGTFRTTPRFEEVQPIVDDPRLSKKEREALALRKEQERSLGQVGVEMLDIQHGTGKMKLGIQFVENRQTSLKIEDFDLLKVVGKGSFGKVMQVQ